VRTAAAESLPFLLECARIRGPDYLAQMWQFICPELLKAVDSEPELDVKAEHMYAVAQVLQQVLLLLIFVAFTNCSACNGILR